MTEQYICKDCALNCNLRQDSEMEGQTPTICPHGMIPHYQTPSWKLIGELAGKQKTLFTEKEQKIILERLNEPFSDETKKETKEITKKHNTGLAKCHNCGVELIAPYDGQPYWCTECSYENDLKRRNKQ